jgi:hypothetical protein
MIVLVVLWRLRYQLSLRDLAEMFLARGRFRCIERLAGKRVGAALPPPSPPRALPTMTDARAFRGFRFPAEVILWAVRWYLQFPISYRDLERMLAHRGVEVDHTTIYRWVQRFAPELEKRLRRHLRPCRGPWHVDENYLRVGGQWRYCIGRSTAPARPSTSGSAPNGTSGRPSASSARRSAGTTPATRAPS